MAYDSNKHHRRSIRLKGYDYSQAGLYFITICVQGRKCLFGKITGGGFTPAQNDRATEMIAPTMELNDFGIIACHQWEKLPERFIKMELDVFQIMPNHMHGIIMLTDTVGAGFTPAQNIAVTHDDRIADKMRSVASPAPAKPKTVGDIVGAYKSLVANDCLEIFKQKYPGKTMGKFWQRNYYEHIIRDEQSYQRISDYIINNPSKWKDDKFYNE